MTWNYLASSSTVAEAMTSGIATQKQIMASGYNSNPAKLSGYINRGGCGWTSLIPKETQMYLQIYDSLERFVPMATRTHYPGTDSATSHARPWCRRSFFRRHKERALGAEAVVFFDKKLGHDFLYLRKQGMQLASKMRFISAQFDALFTGDLWLKSAQHANRMARLLQKELAKIRG